VCKALELFARDADVYGMLDMFLLSEWEMYADVVVACWLGWACWIWGADMQEWTELETWHGGWWEQLTCVFKKWDTWIWICQT
jgi:hypothetical protein